MKSLSANRLQLLQAHYSDQLLTLLTALLLLVLFLIGPLLATNLIAFQIVGFFIALAIIGGALVMSGNRAAFVLMLVGFLLNVAAASLRIFAPSVVDIYLIAAGWMIIAGTLGWVTAHAVFAPGPVTYHRIVGAVLLYLLIGLFFVSLFVFVGLLSPSAFSGVARDSNAAFTSSLVYFSFVTLTSVGYGDILPVHPLARGLCNIEAIIGQLYPATLLARLVSLEIEGRR